MLRKTRVYTGKVNRCMQVEVRKLKPMGRVTRRGMGRVTRGGMKKPERAHFGSKVDSVSCKHILKRSHCKNGLLKCTKNGATLD